MTEYKNKSTIFIKFIKNNKFNYGLIDIYVFFTTADNLFNQTINTQKNTAIFKSKKKCNWLNFNFFNFKLQKK